LGREKAGGECRGPGILNPAGREYNAAVKGAPESNIVVLRAKRSPAGGVRKFFQRKVVVGFPPRGSD